MAINPSVKRPKRSNIETKEEIRAIASDLETGQGGPFFNYCIEQFPKTLRKEIQSVADVICDGNCGFLALSVELRRYREGEDAWMAVGSDLMQNLEEKKDQYLRLNADINKLKKMLDFFTISYNSVAPPRKWMSVVDQGFLIASTYNIAFVCLSQTGSWTYFPLQKHSKGIKDPDGQLVCLGHIKTNPTLESPNHFVLVKLRPNAMLPPAVPVSWSEGH